MTRVPAIPGSSWDVIVVGAGPAGAVAAFDAVRSGHRTLLVDRQSFPRDKACGGCVNRRSLGVLQSLGLGRVVDGLPAVRYTGLTLRTAWGSSARLNLPPGLAVTRRALDHALVGAAVDVGAVFAGGVTARVAPALGRAEGFRRVRVRDRDGAADVVRGRVVVAADGLGHPSLVGLPEFGPVRRVRSRIGLGAVVEANGAYEPGTIHMGVARRGYAGVVRVENGMLAVAAAVDADFLRHAKGPGSAVEGILTNARLPAPKDMDDARWIGTAPLSQALRRPAGWRALAIGDAAGYVEPFTGEGIAWALAGAAAVAPFLQDAMPDWTPETAGHWIRAHARRVAVDQRLCRAASAVLRSPIGSELGVRLLSRFPGLAGPGIRRLSAAPAVHPEARE